MAKIYALHAVPDADAYAFALSQPFVKDHHRRLLTAHARAPGLAIGIGELAARIGRSGHSYINLHYGTLGRKVAYCLDLDPPRYSKGPLWTTALAQGEAMGAYGRWCWRLYPQVRTAVEMLGWSLSSNDVSAD